MAVIVCEHRKIMATKAGRPPRRGRSMDYDEKKQPRNISITDTAWTNIQDEAGSLGLSVSELIEQRGRQQDLLETPMYGRLKATLQQPITVFWPWSECVRRSLWQLGCRTPKEGKKTSDLRVESELLSQTLRKSMQILTLIDYCLPESFIRDLIPVLRWLSWRILSHEQHLVTSKPDPVIADAEIDSALQRIAHAIGQLSEYDPDSYRLLHLRYVDGMSELQIARFRCLNGHKTNGFIVGIEIKEALLRMRRNIHQEVWQPSQITIEPDHDFLRLGEEGKNAKGAKTLNGKDYYQLCALPRLTKSDRQRMEQMLQQSLSDPRIDFTMREIDHWCGHQLMDGSHIKSLHLDDHYSDRHEQLRQQLDASLANDIEKIVSEMNNRLRFCRSAQEVMTALDQVIETVVGFPMPIHSLEIPELKMFAAT
jgi:hypothetical protein